MAHILIIDDDENDRFLLGSLLEELGHSYDQLPNGANAVGTVNASHYDVVALDLIMPEVEGAETLQNLHRELPNVPVVVMSGLGKEYLPMMSHLGAVAVAEKTTDFHSVIAAINNVLAAPAN
jgi:DNA-binding NtrC family response regulator